MSADLTRINSLDMKNSPQELSLQLESVTDELPTFAIEQVASAARISLSDHCCGCFASRPDLIGQNRRRHWCGVNLRAEQPLNTPGWTTMLGLGIHSGCQMYKLRIAHIKT